MERERGENERSPKILAIGRDGPGQSKGPWMQSGSGSLTWMEGSKCLSHHLLLLKVCITRKLELNQESGLKLGHLNMGWRHSKGHLSSYTKCPPLFSVCAPAVLPFILTACRDPLFSPHPVQPLLSAISLIVVNLPRVRRCFHCNSELPFPDERCYWASLLCPFGHLYVFPWKISV